MGDQVILSDEGPDISTFLRIGNGDHDPLVLILGHGVRRKDSARSHGSRECNKQKKELKKLTRNIVVLQDRLGSLDGAEGVEVPPDP